MTNKEKRPDCEWFMLKENSWNTGECQTDGHYLCSNCKCIASFEDMELSDNRIRYYPNEEKEAQAIYDTRDFVFSRYPFAQVLPNYLFNIIVGYFIEDASTGEALSTKSINQDTPAAAWASAAELIKEQENKKR